VHGLDRQCVARTEPEPFSSGVCASRTKSHVGTAALRHSDPTKQAPIGREGYRRCRPERRSPINIETTGYQSEPAPDPTSDAAKCCQANYEADRFTSVCRSRTRFLWPSSHRTTVHIRLSIARCALRLQMHTQSSPRWFYSSQTRHEVMAKIFILTRAAMVLLPPDKGSTEPNIPALLGQSESVRILTDSDWKISLSPLYTAFWWTEFFVTSPSRVSAQ